jgi:hypothetical protein
MATEREILVRLLDEGAVRQPSRDTQALMQAAGLLDSVEPFALTQLKRVQEALGLLSGPARDSEVAQWAREQMPDVLTELSARGDLVRTALLWEQGLASNADLQAAIRSHRENRQNHVDTIPPV